jgi:hypothetical protein
MTRGCDIKVIHLVRARYLAAIFLGLPFQQRLRRYTGDAGHMHMRRRLITWSGGNYTQ